MIQVPQRSITSYDITGTLQMSVRGSYGCGPSLTGGGLPWSGRDAVTSDRAGKRSSRWFHAAGACATVDQEGAMSGAV
jgi:hypothetical protein